MNNLDWLRRLRSQRRGNGGRYRPLHRRLSTASIESLERRTLLTITPVASPAGIPFEPAITFEDISEDDVFTLDRYEDRGVLFEVGPDVEAEPRDNEFPAPVWDDPAHSGRWLIDINGDFADTIFVTPINAFGIWVRSGAWERLGQYRLPKDMTVTAYGEPSVAGEPPPVLGTFTRTVVQEWEFVGFTSAAAVKIVRVSGNIEVDDLQWAAPFLNVSAEHDDEGTKSDTLFGSYLHGVSLENQFTAETSDEITKVTYTVGGMSGTASKLEDGTFHFTIDMGQLQAGNHELLVKGFVGDSVLVEDKSTVKVLGIRNLEVKANTGGTEGPLADIEEVRLIDGIAHPLRFEATIDGPLMEVYKDRVEFIFNGIGFVHKFRQDVTAWNGATAVFNRSTGDLNDGRPGESGDYQIYLTPKEAFQIDSGLEQISDRESLTVISLPSWMKNATGQEFSTDDKVKEKLEGAAGGYVITVDLLKEVNTGTFDPAEFAGGSFLAELLLGGKESGASASLVVTVYATLTKTHAEAFLTSASLQAKLLGKDLVNKNYNLMEAEALKSFNAILDAETLEIDALKIEIPPIQLPTVTLIDFSPSVPVFTLAGIPISLEASLLVQAKNLSVAGTFVFDFRAEAPTDSTFIPKLAEGSFVEFTAQGFANAEIAAKFGDDAFFSIDVGAKVVALLDAKLRLDVTGPLTSPDLSLNEDESFAVLGVGHKLILDINVFNEKYEGNPITADDLDDMAFFPLFEGVATPSEEEVKARLEGLIANAPAAMPLQSQRLSAAAAAPIATVSVAAYQPTFLLDHTITTLEFDATSLANVPTLTPDTHRLETVLIDATDGSETVVSSVDLAELTLSPSENGYRSDRQTVTVLIPDAFREFGKVYEVEFRLFTDSASGEHVAVDVEHLVVERATPQLDLVLGSDVLADGVIDFETEAATDGTVTLILSNAAALGLDIWDVEIVGEGFEIVEPPIEQVTLFNGGGELSLTLRITDSSLAKTATLRFRTDDPDQPEVIIPLVSSLAEFSRPVSFGVARANETGGLTFFLDSNGDREFGLSDAEFNFGLAGDIVVVGDRNGDGIDEVGVARANGTGGLTFFFDSNGNRVFDSADEIVNFGLAGDIVVVGDWNGDGIDDLGVARSNGTGGLTFFLDSDGSRSFELSDSIFNFGLVGDQIVVGDWDGDGIDQVGVARSNGTGGLTFFLDSDGDRFFNAGQDAVFNFGLERDAIVVGNWDGDGTDSVAVARPNESGGQRVFPDHNDDYIFDLTDELFAFDLDSALPDDLLVVGSWGQTPQLA